MHSDPLHVAHHLRWHLGQLGLDPTDGPDTAEVVKAQRERNKTLVDMAKSSAFFYRDFDAYDDKAAQKNLTTESSLLLQDLRESLDALPVWDKESIHLAIEQLAKEAEVKMGAVAQPLRVAVSGTTVSPPIDITLYLLGKNKTLTRIERAVDYIAKNSTTTG
jgi:glutamyl-tRNA synthetase